MDMNMKLPTLRAKQILIVPGLPCGIFGPAAAAFLRTLALSHMRDPRILLALLCPASLHGAIPAHLATLNLHFSLGLGGIA